MCVFYIKIIFFYPFQRYLVKLCSQTLMKESEPFQGHIQTRKSMMEVLMKAEFFVRKKL
jgi:hypothetical protein